MTIDDYILAQDKAIQPELRAVRDTIRARVGEAEERMSWQMPTWWRGHNLIHFAAQKQHVGVYPGPEAVEAFLPELDEKGDKHSKGAIRMPYGRVDLELLGRIAAWRGR
jgi:uncharacterized protein YdhG (YjbR/CyaY superfamily)